MWQREVRGIIRQDEIPVAFEGRNHHFVFLPLLNEKDGIILKTENGFIRGKTYQGDEVLIYCQEDLDLKSTLEFDTWLYIVGNASNKIDTYQSIEFTGGSLNSVFHFQKLENSIRNTVDENDIKSFPINDEHVSSIELNATGTEIHNSKEGNWIRSTGTSLELKFKKNEDIRTTFCSNYSDVFAIVQFMTFRKNVNFESVTLHKDLERNGSTVSVLTGKCYIVNDLNDIEKYTKGWNIYNDVRNSRHCITFDDLTEENVNSLYQNIVSRNTGKSKYFADFLPESKEELNNLGNRRIRDICTAVEIEADLNAIKASHSENFETVVNEIKEIISNSRKDPEKRLTDREYSYIESSIQKWRAPAAELAKQLFDLEKEKIHPLLHSTGINDLSEKDIAAVIKIRNNLTHSGFSESEKKDVNTAFILMAAVYASVLSRFGCTSEQIRKFFIRGLMTERN